MAPVVHPDKEFAGRASGRLSVPDHPLSHDATILPEDSNLDNGRSTHFFYLPITLSLPEVKTTNIG